MNMTLTFNIEEIEQNLNVIDFQTYGKGFLGEFIAEKINVYNIGNSIDIYGTWNKNRTFYDLKGVIEVEFSPDKMEEIRSGRLGAVDILNMTWGKWWVSENEKEKEKKKEKELRQELYTGLELLLKNMEVKYHLDLNKPWNNEIEPLSYENCLQVYNFLQNYGMLWDVHELTRLLHQK
jgi:hypothetical protein